jgi:isopropylmalate/homocitrate/citramalate synthase
MRNLKIMRHKEGSDRRMSTIKYAIEYEHLADELIANENAKWNFNQVKNNANKYQLELSDEDFKQLFKLQKANKDIEWIMHKMSAYKLTIVEALVSYITY